MNNFYRALRFTWPYRFRIAISVVCALMVAVLWGGNLSAVYPVMPVFFRDQTLQFWISQKVTKGAIELEGLRQGTALLEAQLESPDTLLPPDARQPASLDAIRLKLTTLRVELAAAEWKQRWKERAGNFIHRFVPEDRVLTLVCIMLAVIVGLGFKGVFVYLNDVLVGWVAHLAVFDLKNRLYQHAMKMDISTFTQAGSSELMSRFTNDTQTLRVGIETLLGKMVLEPLRAVVCFAAACWLNWRLTLAVLAIVPVTGLIMTSIGRYLRQATRRSLESMSSIYGILQESFQGIKIVKAFTMESYERRRFFQGTKNFLMKSMRLVKLEAMLSPVTEMASVGGISVAVLVGAALVTKRTTHILGIKMASAPMSAEAMLLFYTFLAGISDPVRKLTNVYGRLQRAAAAADRLFGFLDKRPTIVDGPAQPRLPRHSRSIRFQDVEFAYPDSPPVLKRVSLDVQFGETIALVGPNGCGKTTLLSLLARFYDPQNGCVSIDGVDIREVHTRSLREQIGIVTQETVLFNDTILNNIAYGKRNASRAEIEAAAKKAYAHQFIDDLPGGYDTVVGEQGAKLSGGQRQRIALARAILRDPSILLLDEATSALDIESELLIQRALESFVRNRTTFLITHRLSVLELADRIVVMNEGRIEDVGLHHELMARCALYARLYEIHSATRISA